MTVYRIVYNGRKLPRPYLTFKDAEAHAEGLRRRLAAPGRTFTVRQEKG